MIDHIGLQVRNVARATEFYLKALVPLGYGIVMEVSAEETSRKAHVGFGAPGQPDDFQSGKPSSYGRIEVERAPRRVIARARERRRFGTGGATPGRRLPDFR